MHLYVAGPMRGYELFNFPAFARASAYLRAIGHEVTSPAEMDLDMGLDPTIANTDAEQDFDVADALRRDFEVILKCDGIVLIEGWQDSSGARAERWVAETTGKQVFLLRPHGGSYMLRQTEPSDWDGDPRKPEADVKTEAPAFSLADQKWLAEGRRVGARMESEARAECFPGESTREADVRRRKDLLTARAITGQPFTQAENDELNGYIKMDLAKDFAEAFGEGENPKDRLGVKKPQLHLVPSALSIHVARAMGDGAVKYGPFNWREKAVKASVYQSAAKRHLEQWFDGEDVADDSGVHHLAHAAACIGILLDALETGNLADDRPTPGAASALIKRFTDQ